MHSPYRGGREPRPADVPVKGGDNRITYRAWNTPFFSGAAKRHVDVSGIHVFAGGRRDRRLLRLLRAEDAPALGEGVFTAEIQVQNFQPIAVEKAMYWNAVSALWAAGTNVTATRMPPQ